MTAGSACILGYLWGQLEALFQMLAPHPRGATGKLLIKATCYSLSEVLQVVVVVVENGNVLD